jgi:hypothetical protein
MEKAPDKTPSTEMADAKIQERDSNHRTDLMIKKSADDALSSMPQYLMDLTMYYQSVIKTLSIDNVNGGDALPYLDRDGSKKLCPTLSLGSSETIPTNRYAKERMIYTTDIPKMLDYLLFVARCVCNERGIELVIKPKYAVMSQSCYVSVDIVNTNVIYRFQLACIQHTVKKLFPDEVAAKYRAPPLQNANLPPAQLKPMVISKNGIAVSASPAAKRPEILPPVSRPSSTASANGGTPHSPPPPPPAPPSPPPSPKKDPAAIQIVNGATADVTQPVAIQPAAPANEEIKTDPK